MRLNPILTGWLGLCALALIGCGDDEGGAKALDPSSWSGMHANEIQKDCAETVQCSLERGDEVLEDPVNNCVRSTAKLLESTPDQQSVFLSNVGRCQLFRTCEYVGCAITDATSSYGEMQRGLVSQDCTAEVECQTATGNPPADPAGKINICTETNIGVLNNYGAQMRMQYEMAFQACATLASCDFVNCFGF